MAKSTAKISARKVSNGWAKPYPDFSLSYHPPSGRLYKKIRGKRHDFGYVKDWQAAVNLYTAQRDDAGKTPEEDR